jgi:hypothetical protein
MFLGMLRSARSLRRVFWRGGFALAVLAVVAQLGSFVHFATVVHEVCATHDELAHPTDLTVRHDTGEGSATSRVRRDLPQARAHEHCSISVLLQRRAALRIAGGCGLAGPTFGGRVSSFVQVSGIERSFPLYLLAPKASPPVVG